MMKHHLRSLAKVLKFDYKKKWTTDGTFDKNNNLVKMRARTTSQIDWWHARLTIVSLGGHAPSSGFYLIASI